MSTPDFYSLIEVEGSEVPEKKESTDFYALAGEKEEPSRLRSLISAPLKGLVKGAAKFSPLPSFGPVPVKLGERVTEHFLPTQKKTAEDILEFTAENAPLALMGEGGLAKKGIQAVSGALAKKGAKELDLPEWAQEIVGGLGMAAPDVVKGVSKAAISPSAKQKPIVDYLRSQGLSEKQITPLIQDKKKLNYLSKISSKFEKKDPFIKGIKEKLGGIFEDIREKGSQGSVLEGEKLYQFEENFDKAMEKVPRMYRRLIKAEIEDLNKHPINFKELHDFNKAINAIVGNVEGGKAAVGLLKEPIEKAMQSLSPGLYSELKMANNVYSRLSGFMDKMTKRDWESLLSLGQTGGLITGILTLNPGMMGTALGSAAGRLALKKILTSPRLQGVHRKMWEAFLNNRIPQMLKYAGILEREVKEEENQ